MHIINGTMHSTPLPWLSVLSKIEPPPLRRKAAVDKLIYKADCILNGCDTTTCSFLCETACHYAGPSGQTLTQQTSSPRGEMKGSQLRWSILLQR